MSEEPGAAAIEVIDREQLRSKKMKEMPVGKLLFVMALPAIVSMLVQALYNVADTIFIGMKYGLDGITALSIANPMQLLMIAAAIGIGVGTNVQIAKKLGEGKPEEASQAAKTGMLLSVIGAVIFTALGFIVSGPFIEGFTEAGGAVAEYGTTYLSVCMIGCAGVFVGVNCARILQATGNMKMPMISQLIGAIINIALDPLFIFVFDMGTLGAALATVIGQVASMLFALAVFIFKKQDVSISPRGFRVKRTDIASILIIGLPTIVMNAVNAFTVLILNLIVIPINEFGIPILGVYLKLNAFVFMPLFGLMQGLMPILSYNFGYGDKARYKQAYKKAMITSLIIMTVGFILFLTMPQYLVRLFGIGGDVSPDRVSQYIAAATTALRIIAVCFLPAAFNVVNTTATQSLGKGAISLIMSLLRQVIILIPMAALLGYITIAQNGTGFWFSYPIAETVVFLIFTPYALRMINKRFAEKEKARRSLETD
ncbi:MAG: MATE family efflux transporter [Clostridiales bacterium]|jgi:putative MATE family efflux protein|nr:MATE family efflux transporter [Clostridiales bacterium]